MCGINFNERVFVSMVIELNVGRIIFSPRFAVTTMATGPKMNYCVLLSALNPPEIKTTQQKHQTQIKYYWRTAFAWITNFMN